MSVFVCESVWVGEEIVVLTVVLDLLVVLDRLWTCQDVRSVCLLSVLHTILSVLDQIPAFVQSS